MKKHLPVIIIIGLSLLLSLLVSPIRAFNLDLCSVIAFCVYAAFVYYIIGRKKDTMKPTTVLYASMFGAAILSISAYFISLGAIYSLPDQLFHLLGCFVGYLLYKYPKARVVIILLSIALLAVYYLVLGGMWRAEFSLCGK